MKRFLRFMRRSLFACALLCSVAGALAAGTFSVVPLTGDADSGIAADSVFTHAINVNDAGNVSVNGAIFTGSGTAANPATNNYVTSGFNNVYTGFAAPVTGAVGSLMTNFLYNGSPAVVTLNNLRTGQKYESVFYNAAFGGAGIRFQTITASDGGSIVFDQNGLTGSLLRYAFTAASRTMTFSISPQVAGNTFHQYAFSNRAVGMQALFPDNFYVLSNPGTADLNFNLAARQGGSLVKAGGTIAWVGVGNTQVGNTTGAIDAGNYLLTAFGSGIAALNHNFNGTDSAGGISIAFDMAPDVGAQAGVNWCGIALGQAAADKSGAINGTQPHFGVLFRGASGTLQALDGASVLTATEPSWGSTGVTTQLHHIELQFADSLDSNPFDGVGETHVDVFADGVLRYSFTKSGGGYSQNYINFQSSYIGGIDNVVIARLNATPAAPVFTTQPLAQTLWRGDVLTISGEASGFPAPTYQWFFNGNPISGATSATYSPADSGNAGGSYKLVATNSQGSVSSSTVLVSVIAPTRAQQTWEGLGASSRRTGLTISEIQYHAPARLDGKNLEFVELYNSNPWMEDLAGYRLTGDWDFTFPAGTQIVGKGFLIIAKVPADVQSVYGLSGVLGGFTKSLSNSGGTVRLRKPSGAVVLEVSWNDHAPWPVAADGTGHSLVLARPSYGEGDPRAWDASASIGGSPGAGDVPPGSAQDLVALNEVLTRSDLPLVDFVELRNDAPSAVDISGCTLSDDPWVLGKFIIPAGTTLASGATISFTETQLGFALSADGESLYLTNAAATRVLDCVRLPGSAANVSFGRVKDRPGPFLPLAAMTPGAPNSAARTPDVLISEIFFDPISGDDLDEWLEIYNPGSTAIDLGGWKFNDGVSFTFPVGTSIAAGARLVVAKSAVRTRSNHPEISGSLVIGDYSGTLANSGDKITLVRPETVGLLTINVEVDTVTFSGGGRWSKWAAGGGSSLELIDARADRTQASAWADSDESAKAPWTTLSLAGPLDLGHSAVAGADRVQLFLMGPGETLIDDVNVIPSGGANVVSNGGFESGLTGWSLQGNQSRSSVTSGAGFGGGAALQLRASDDGDPDGNRVYAALTSTLAANSTATISARTRWLRGTRELILRLRGGFLEAFGKLSVPANLGTPGAPNSRALANAGPSISDVSHRPLLPAAGVPIRVFAKVSDPDGIASATLRWRLDTSGTFTNVAMRDDGTNGDIFAGDGVFTGTIPAPASGALIVFRVESTDAAVTPASAIFPPDALAHPCMVRVGEPAQGGDFSAYRVWLTAANITTWANREKFGNEPIDATFIYNNVRAIYGCGMWYKGSEATTPGYNSPVGGLCGYHIAPPAGDLVLNSDNFTLDWPIRDTTDQREQLMFWMAEQLHLPNLYRRYIHLFVNGSRRGTISDDVQEPGGTLVQEYFPSDNNGHLYKTNNWNEGADNANSTSAGVSNLLQHYDSGGQHKLARYRWNWRPRASPSVNEFGDMFTLIDAVNASAGTYQSAVESVVDTENWMRTFAFHDLCSYWDSFGNPNTKNTYLYKPVSGRWTQFTWDMDVGLGVFNDPVDTALFPATADSKIDAFQAYAPFRRIYWRTVHEAFSTFFSGTGVTPLLQRKYDALAATGLGLASPFAAGGAYGLSVPGWIDQRRAFIQTQLNTVAATFALTSPSSVTVTAPSVTLSGNAPVNVQTLTVNGLEYPVKWNSVTAWSITLVPTSGTKPYVVRALDYNGAQVGTATATVTFTGTNAWPALRINEWMATNSGSVLDPADGASDDWIELFNPTAAPVSLTGWRLSDSSPAPTEFIFPSGYSLSANGRLIAWADNETVQSLAPSSLHLPFKLSSSGETLTLTAPDGTVIDTVTFGEQVSDISQGRVPDGGATIAFLTTPSAGGANTPAVLPPAASLTIAGVLTITVNTTPGFSYQLQAKDNLSDALWANFGSALTATGPKLTFSDTGSTGIAHRFYRVVRTP